MYSWLIRIIYAYNTMTTSFFGKPPMSKRNGQLQLAIAIGKITIAIGKFLTIAIDNCNWVKITAAIALRIRKIRIRIRLLANVFHNQSQCHWTLQLEILWQLQLGENHSYNCILNREYSFSTAATHSVLTLAIVNLLIKVWHNPPKQIKN